MSKKKRSRLAKQMLITKTKISAEKHYCSRCGSFPTTIICKCLTRYCSEYCQLSDRDHNKYCKNICEQNKYPTVHFDDGTVGTRFDIDTQLYDSYN